MELIDLSQAIIDLEALEADQTSIELVLNNIKLYNNLVLDYTVEGLTKNLYLTYQLNVQITKQMSELRKDYARKRPQAQEKVEEEEGLPALIRSLKEEGKGKKK
jgi:hypothetical protein